MVIPAAEIVSDDAFAALQGRGRPAKYPYAEWFDGQARRIVPTKNPLTGLDQVGHYDTDSSTMITNLHNAASRGINGSKFKLETRKEKVNKGGDSDCKVVTAIVFRATKVTKDLPIA